MKFSIIVPVYNVENYVIKCLESIFNQSYKNYEVIIVNDGSTDHSGLLIKKYIYDKKNFYYYEKNNGGLSEARNYGVEYVRGNYILFVDSDDYIDKNLLYKLNEVLLTKKYDIIKFNFIDLIDGKKNEHIEQLKQSGELNIKDIINFDYFEPACSYCYNADFYKNNKFNFEIKKYHEDFGLIPIILLKAASIYYLNYFGYIYLKRENSIINDFSKNEKKALDVLYFTIKNIKLINEEKNISEQNKALLLNFYANSAIYKTKTLINKKEYIKKLKYAKIYKCLLNKTIKQKIKKIICKISYNLYVQIFMRG